jgi:hypothetical protein
MEKWQNHFLFFTDASSGPESDGIWREFPKALSCRFINRISAESRTNPETVCIFHVPANYVGGIVPPALRAYSDL